MDGQDRMFRRLVQNIRAGFPDLLTRPFEVSAIHQHLVPYRLNRGELGLDSAEEYELTLMRLLSGAGGMLERRSGHAGRVARGTRVTEPRPLALPRVGDVDRVRFPVGACARSKRSRPSPVRSPSPGAPTRQAEMAGRATLEVPTSRPVTATMMAYARSVATPPVSMTAAAARADGATASTEPAVAIAAANCPDGRDAHFCPHCGQNLSVKQCPACSTELEVEWQFCITCGRQGE